MEWKTIDPLCLDRCSHTNPGFVRHSLADPELSSAQAPGYYGYNSWTNGTDSEGSRNWLGAAPDTYSASGYNNNAMFVVPRWNMVVVGLGLDQNDGRISDEGYGEFHHGVGQSIEN